MVAVSTKHAAELLNALRPKLQLEPSSRALLEAADAILSRGLPTLEPLLPCLLRLKGKPFNLDRHFPFEPFYNTMMPKKIVLKSGRQVSKSTSLAAQGIIRANSIPFFNTLFVTPLYEMVRRFSSNYVKDFIEQSPFRKLWTCNSVSANVLQRTFRNKSTMFFSYAFMNADRTRGINADCMVVDESVMRGSHILVRKRLDGVVSGGYDARVPIEQLVPGDLVHAFDDQARLVYDRVKTASCHGIRDCYEITLATGEAVAATTDSFIATTAGWRRIETVIEELFAAATAAVAGHDVGGCPPTATGDGRRQPGIHQPAWLETAGLQQGEVPTLSRVRKQSTQEGTEFRLRRMVEFVQYAQNSGSLGYRVFVHPQAQEARHAAMARSADLGRRSLVVPRRRQPSRQIRQHAASRIPHRRLLITGGETAGQETAVARAAGQAAQNQKPTRRGEGLHRHPTDGTQYPQTDRENQTLHRAVDVVQNGAHAAAHISDLQSVRQGPPTHEGPGTLQGQADVLLFASVPPGREENRAAQIRQPSRDPRKSPRKGQTADAYLRRVPRVSPPQSGRMAEIQPGQGQDHQAALPGQTTGSTETATLDLSALRPDGTPRRPRSQDEVLSEMSGASHGTDQASVGSPLPAAEIVGIKWVGRHEVYDIETENHHTFFAGGVAVHNCQDLDPTFIPIIENTLSGSPWELQQFAGTSKTTDNTLEKLWSQSSQGEWMVPCLACGRENWPSIDLDLDAMIGPWRSDISLHNPAVICARPRCRKPIDPAIGRWVHRHPNRLENFAGYHIPQIIMPFHYGDQDKWAVLRGKQEGRFNTGTNVFYNEVCGEAYDSSAKLVSLTDIKKAAILPWKNDIHEAKKHMLEYDLRIMSADWGGGGMAGGKHIMSWTVFTIMGWKNDGTIDVLYSHRSLTPHDADREGKILCSLLGEFKCNFFVHDFNGAGRYREKVAIDAGYPFDRVVPVWYVPSMAQQVMKFVPVSEHNTRALYRLDKPRSLVLTCGEIRRQRIRFFAYDNYGDDNPGVLDDFLALVENKTDSRMGRDVYAIIRDPGHSDDFAHTVNMGACFFWEYFGAWPDLAEASRYSIDDELLEWLSPHEPSWQ